MSVKVWNILAIALGLAACASLRYTDVLEVASNPNSFDNKTLQLKGYIVVDAINIPHLFSSEEDAKANGKEDNGIDLLPETRDIDLKTRYHTVTCVIASGVFHAPTPKNLGMGTLTSKIGSLSISDIQLCKS